MANEIKPRLRDEEGRNYGYRISQLLKELFKNDNYPFQNCTTCCHWDGDKTELCRLYKMRPPARVIAYGCPSYVDFDNIPF